MRKYPRRNIAGLAVVCMALALAACSGDKPQQAAVGPDGNTITLNGVTVTVPADAIQSQTELVVSEPQRVQAQDAPFGQSTATQVDISFKDGSQPAEGKPLEVIIPLTGEFLPDGVQPQHALLYHKLPDGAGFRLLPAVVEGQELHALLPHLSEWQVVYLDDQALEEAFASGALEVINRADCTNELTARSTGEVRIGPGSEGWSSDDNSPIHACLYNSNDDAALSITNNLNYMLLVAATGGLELESPSRNVEEDIVRLINDTLFPNDRVATYLGREGELTAIIGEGDLPATVQLKSDPSTFLSESAWFSLKFLAGIFLGKKGGDIERDIRLLIEAPQVVSCLQDSLRIAEGETPSVGDVLGLITSQCTQVIADQLGVLAANTNVWDSFWKRFAVIGEGIVGGWNTFWSGVEGIRMEIHGTMTVHVTAVAPCPSDEEFLAIMERHFNAPVRLATTTTCQDGWAYNRTAKLVTEGGNSYYTDGAHTLLHLEGGQWIVLHSTGTGPYFIGLDGLCDDPLPPAIYDQLCFYPNE